MKLIPNSFHKLFRFHFTNPNAWVYNEAFSTTQRRDSDIFSGSGFLMFSKLVSMSSIAPQDDSDIFSGSGFLFAFKATVESLWFPYLSKATVGLSPIFFRVWIPFVQSYCWTSLSYLRV